MPCSVPSTPNQPHLGGKTKTSFTIKWTVSICNCLGEPSLFLHCTLKIKISPFHFSWRHSGLMVIALTSLDQAVLAGNTVLCSWVRHFTLTVPPSTQVYKWVLANLMLGVMLQWTSIPSSGGGGRNTPFASCFRN